MTALAIAPLYVQMGVVGTESVLVALGVLLIFSSVWGFKVLRRAF